MPKGPCLRILIDHDDHAPADQNIDFDSANGQRRAPSNGRKGDALNEQRIEFRNWKKWELSYSAVNEER